MLTTIYELVDTPGDNLNLMTFKLTKDCFRISNAKKPKETEFKAKDAENLDKQNMRDVQLSEYEKRKRQMKELDKLVSLSLSLFN